MAGSDRAKHIQFLPRKRILVVDDSLEIRESLADLLGLENYEAAVAGDGQAALDYLLASSEKPDLIILDLLMQGMSGYEFLKRQKTEPNLKGISVIIMTANQIQHAKSLGAEGFLRKP